MTTYERSWLWVKEKKRMVLVFITITMMLQFQMKGCVGCVESERTGLLQIKSYLKSFFFHPEKSGILKSWSPDDPKSECCHWEGVRCSDAIGGHIVYLSLGGLLAEIRVPGDEPNYLNLSLLHSFPQLQSLNLSSNLFYPLFDPIQGYKSLQSLEKLRTLDFSGNVLNNSGLPFISAARSLTTLNLGGNRLKGVFPPNELANMTGLRVLNLENNEFSFFTGQGLINFRELEELDLSGNQINDSDATDGLRTTKLDLGGTEFSEPARIKVLENMPKLQQLDLSYNKFTDLDSLGLVLPLSLEVLNLKKNQFSLTQKGQSKICRLINLRELDVRFNALTNMPNCLGNLTRLRTLDLSHNYLNGDLSSFVSGLPTALEYLSLLDNNFNGSFLFKSLVNQTSLTVFRVSSKVGMIQVQAESSWVPLFQLKTLTLQNFILGSTVPGFLLHQHDLCFIDLSDNKLTGAFPTWLVQNNSRLEITLLNSNSLTELQLPRFANGLRFLDISSNRISSSVQEDIGIVLPKLMYMNFSSNNFRGTIPSSINKMKSLQVLDMSSNGLSGQLPETFLSSRHSLEVLKLSNNQFQGRIFPEHANLTSLLWLALDGNNFNGSLGKGLLNSNDLFLLDISDNTLSGTLPLWIGRMSDLLYLNTRGNQLKGHFPHQLQNLRKLEVVDISNNSFSGFIPRKLDFPTLKVLTLRSNEFTGIIPNTLFMADDLQVLDLRNNNFSGMPMDNISEFSDLRVLLLRNNSFRTHIPEKICQLDNVGLLDLSHNKFRGAIPSCFSKMSFGGTRLFNFRNFATDFYIRIPFSANWSYTSALNLDGDFGDSYQSTPATLVDFLTKRRYETYEGYILRQMHGLDLSSNQLSGEIPVDIGDVLNLRSLNLSSNHLTGSIPCNISKLENLESLDLSNNKLDGKIPPQLADLDSLGFFNVSYNQLSGEIPFQRPSCNFFGNELHR